MNIMYQELKDLRKNLKYSFINMYRDVQTNSLCQLGSGNES
jgi:hypothetical protein